MKSLQSFTYNEIEITTGQKIDVSESFHIIISEIFEIDGCTYVSLALPTETMKANVINKETKEIEKSFDVNRSFAIAEYFIESNLHIIKKSANLEA